MGQDYLLLDGACFEHLPSLLMQLDPSAAPYPLYANTRYAELNRLGPWLVAVAPGGPIARAFQREWSVDSGLWLRSCRRWLGRTSRGCMIRFLRCCMRGRL